MAANFFGDRWTFLQVNGYMWVLAGLLFVGADLFFLWIWRFRKKLRRTPAAAPAPPAGAAAR